jgi:5-formaminoimidazole-4-carboxamide-1-beta-D-ribofuranosyl 5'-monophosphate synthetase
MKITKRQLRRIIRESLLLETGAAGTALTPDQKKRAHAVIGEAFTLRSILEDDMRYIVFQLRRRGGEVVNINMEDLDGMLGHTTTGISADDARRHGTTLAEIEQALRDGGARERQRAKPSRRTFSWYD